ncbi:MAG: GNAT family N-acetyltransferase [Lachnospiraceae bacterium]|nr:GNAT family N-acetyltransferase [Lachnospiraceae bacterium]
MMIRQINEKDDSIIAGLIRKNLEAANLNVPGTVYFDKEIDYLSKVYVGPESKYFVYTDENDKALGGIGFARFSQMEDTAELQKLYLDDSIKGKGVSYELVSFIEEEVKKAGYKKAYLETHENLQIAIHLYEKCGYERIARPENVQHGKMTHFYLKTLV